MNGVLLLDKEQGITSNRALQNVKKLFEAKKAGHTGTLDPLASGVLPICLGKATRIAGQLLQSDKTYAVGVQLGVKTDTADSEGKVTHERSVPILSDQQLEETFQQFRGEIMQIPPMFSAIKINGKRLYDLARQGIVVQRAPRQVKIHQLILVAKPGLERLELRVACGKGTYIRALVDDIGETLGCGAHVIALRRTEVGCFKIEESYSYSTLKQIKEQEGLLGLEKTLHPLQEFVNFSSKELALCH